MSRNIAEWLEHMRDAREPGPAIRIVIRRKGQSVGTFELTAHTDLGELADSIVDVCEDFVPPRCELRALDKAERTVGFLRVGATSFRRSAKSKEDPFGSSAIVE